MVSVLLIFLPNVRMHFFSLCALHAVPISSSVISVTTVNTGEQLKSLCSCLQAVPLLALPGCDDNGGMMM